MDQKRADQAERLQRAMAALEQILSSERYQRLKANSAPSRGDRPDVPRDARSRAGHLGFDGAPQPAGASRYSATTYADEPIITTGRQMRNYLPERCRQMKAISRYAEGTGGQRGRWLSDAEYFYLQARFMEDYEDDCPYHGAFKAYYPTYNALSDHQLRGYFTWRAQVRRGLVEESSTSFAYLYLYELICGIGVREPLEGFHTMEWFWQSYRAFAPELDRFAKVWLQDYAVYHGLAPELLADTRAVEFDRALIALRDAGARAREAGGLTKKGGGRARGPVSTLPLPVDAALEEELFCAIDALSTYRLKNSRFYKEQPEFLRHVACGVFVRLSAYYDKNRKASLMESWFGEHMEQPYFMFASAVFFEPEPHPDTVYELDGVHRYRCQNNRWTCERYHGSRQKSPELGRVMRAVDRNLRTATGFAHPLKESAKTPKYLQKFIDDEIAAWTSWQDAHQPVRIQIDLSQLAGIRAAAADTREALLVDEEREGAPAGAGGSAPSTPEPDPTPLDATELIELGTVPNSITSADDAALSPAQARYLRCLVEGASAGRRLEAAAATGLSEDLLVDAINDALFELVGDTVIEFGPDGPELVEDYAEDVREVLSP